MELIGNGDLVLGNWNGGGREKGKGVFEIGGNNDDN